MTIAKNIFLILVIFGLSASLSFALSSEMHESRASMVTYWADFKYEDCNAESLVRSMPGNEYLASLAQVATKPECSMQKSPQCFEQIDRIIGSEMSQRAKRSGCEESADYKKFVRSKQKPPLPEADIICNTVMKNGQSVFKVGKVCRQVLKCRNDFQMYGHEYDDGSYSVDFEPLPNGECPEYYKAAKRVISVEKSTVAGRASDFLRGIVNSPGTK